MRYLCASLAVLVSALYGQPQPSQASAAQASKDTITSVKRSPPRAGASGHEYSSWYVIGSDPAPAGYHVSDSQLSFEGSPGVERKLSCGATAQCIEGERTQSKSTWLFRMQGSGSNERPAPEVAVLTTTYRKDGNETSYTLTVSSKEKFSSRGAFFGCFDGPVTKIPAAEGPWCSLSAAHPKPGYRIRSGAFSLEGDRSCFGNDYDPESENESAQCRAEKTSGDELTWQFRMLGSDEDGKETTASGFGRLTVVYEKLP